MQAQPQQSEQGHWILANLGKKVLRPGGKELTIKLIEALQIKTTETVVEFAPGKGLTASIILHKNPKTYFGIEQNALMAQQLIQKIKKPSAHIIQNSAAQTCLPNASVDKVMGEAMLTMQIDHRKSEIIKEAYRILKPGGYYAIHELGLTPSNIDASIKKEILLQLAQVIKVNARPLTQSEWCSLLEKEGFKIKYVFSNPMLLMDAKRMMKDEGFWGFLKIMYNAITKAGARQKVLAIRNVFKKHRKHLTAIAIIAEKK